ncbi:MaoC family dehydratase [Rhodococcus sp. 114MFTsu3.1]|uniref:MaoC family dehydratase n=1 Tax=Rhodococcus sp. 114MFTsu3.1 TaxID=1172184 RepID=UPI00035FDD15
MSVVESPRKFIRSPYFDELVVGQVFDTAPSVTLTEGLAAVHSSIVGNRYALSLDRASAQAVCGGFVVNPALVWDISIGQSTLATQHVRANLFYRGLHFHRSPVVGDTLRTTTVVEALRENARKPERSPTGLVVLRITTVDQHERTVLDYRRCAMVLLSPLAPETGHRDYVSSETETPESVDTFSSVVEWDTEELSASGGLKTWEVGTEFEVLGGDVVSSAPELARLTGNLARVHHDSAAGGGARLVYGGHSIGIAFHHVCQAIPGVVAVSGWHGCDHVGPVHEGDFLTSTVTIESVEPNADGLCALGLRVVTSSRDVLEQGCSTVLVWRPIVIVR